MNRWNAHRLQKAMRLSIKDFRRADSWLSALAVA